MLDKLCNVTEYHHHSIFTVTWILLKVSSILVLAKASVSFPQSLLIPLPCLRKQVCCHDLSGEFTVTDLIKKAEHTCNRSCFQTGLSKMRMEDLRLNENKFVKIAMWFPSILKHALITQEMNLISMFLLKRKKYIEKVLVK